MAQPNKTKIPLGTLLAGKYRVTREIGRGGMAAVYEAENVDIGKRVAIKVLAAELTASTIVVERFLREARAAAAIRSPYICDVYDSGRLDDGRPFLVLELLEGDSLYERMTKIRHLDVETTLLVMVQTCRGLTKAHSSNIVHRDLKPENIFVTKDEEGKLLAKILDFGLAKFYAPLEGNEQQQRLTREGAVFGTPAYMSPEQVRGQGAVDHRADLWALGCIVYECLTGKTVWSTEQGVAMTFAQIANAPIPKPADLRPDLPPEFTAWFNKALDRRIDERFQSAKQFADELVEAFNVTRSSLGIAPSGESSAHIPLESLGVHAEASRRAAADVPTMSPPPVGPTTPAPELASTLESATAPSSARGSKLGFVSPSHTKDAAPAAPPPPKRSSSLGRGVVVLGVLGLLGVGGYAGWTQLVEPLDPPAPLPSASATVAAPAPTPSTAPSAPPDAGPPVPLLPWEPLVHEAQQAITTGDLKAAMKLLKEAYDKGNHGVPRTMLEHVQMASSQADKAVCKLTGLARPRSYDLIAGTTKPVHAYRPSIALGPRGPVVVWTDAHEGSEHAWAVLLDPAMRDVSKPVDVTPEGTAIGRPEISFHGDKFVLTYWDAKGPEAGVHARFVDPDGHIGGPSVAIAPSKGGNHWPSLAATSEGGYYIVWTDDHEHEGDQLFLRRLAPTLEPKGNIVRVTEFAPNGPNKPRARFASMAVEGGAIQLAFRFEREPQHLIQRIRLPVADATTGLDMATKHIRKDKTIGELVLVNTEKAKTDGPDLACGGGSCFIVWLTELGGGASAAYVDPNKTQPMWRKRFSKTGTHPAVAVASSGNAEVVWYEAGKLMVAPLNRDGVGTPSKVARVNGEQPMPSISPGAKPGEWYLAWQDHESGHLEPYAARVQCK